MTLGTYPSLLRMTYTEHIAGNRMSPQAYNRGYAVICLAGRIAHARYPVVENLAPSVLASHRSGHYLGLPLVFRLVFFLAFFCFGRGALVGTLLCVGVWVLDSGIGLTYLLTCEAPQADPAAPFCCPLHLWEHSFTRSEVYTYPPGDALKCLPSTGRTSALQTPASGSVHLSRSPGRAPGELYHPY